MTATERPSDRELLDEAIDLLCGCAPLAWTLDVNLEHAKEYEKRIVAFIDRARTLDAAPAEPVVSAECWRRAIAETFDGWEWPPVVEQRAVALAREWK